MEALIVLEDVHKVYSMGEVEVHALRGASLTIYPGEFVAIMGPSGSGKSTLMSILGCLDRPTRGRYWLDGIDIGTQSPDVLAAIRNQKIGFVFQSFNLLPRTTALENVELPLIYNGVPAAQRTQRAREALAQLGLEGREQHHPSQLSGGQQQRVAIARALVNDSPILLADEPTGNLDEQTSGEIMEIFSRLNHQGKTIVMITHETEVAAYASRTMILRDGMVYETKEV
jgi:putative ABC transport system ATP-binding protein